MNLDLERVEVGPWPMNCYLLRCPVTGQLAVVDPGAEADIILAAVGDAAAGFILLTHAHPDHIGALEVVRSRLSVPVGVHPADAVFFGIEADYPLLDGITLEVGRGRLKVSHVPGHTPGSVCFRLDGQALVGDAIFPGGPGHTSSPEALTQSLQSLGRTVFTWRDDTELFPGHGTHTTVGAERLAFERFAAAELPADLCGDVSWR